MATTIEKRQIYFKSEFLKNYKDCKDIKLACAKTGIVYPTLCKWKKFDSEFSKSIDVIKNSLLSDCEIKSDCDECGTMKQEMIGIGQHGCPSCGVVFNT